jgi:hypothetical protein
VSRVGRLLDARAQQAIKPEKQVRCMRHGEGNGFVVCLHVLDGRASVHFIENIGRSHPTMGTILCRECTSVGGGAKAYLRQEDFGLACAQCAQEKGLTRIGGRINVEREEETPLLILPNSEPPAEAN